MALQPVISSNSDAQNWGQVNTMVRSLNKEQQIKAFNGADGKPAIIVGKYATNAYGSVYSDTNGYRRILIGQAPNDGRPGIWVSKDGVDVITELGG